MSSGIAPLLRCFPVGCFFCWLIFLFHTKILVFSTTRWCADKSPRLMHHGHSVAPITRVRVVAVSQTWVEWWATGFERGSHGTEIMRGWAVRGRHRRDGVCRSAGRGGPEEKGHCCNGAAGCLRKPVAHPHHRAATLLPRRRQVHPAGGLQVHGLCDSARLLAGHLGWGIR